MDAEGDSRLLFVPVRDIGSGVLALRTGRLPSGQRVGLAFTSTASLLAALGPGQPWIRLRESACRTEMSDRYPAAASAAVNGHGCSAAHGALGLGEAPVSSR
jgi:hypothetical protein